MATNQRIQKLLGSIRARLTKIESELDDLNRKLDHLIERGAECRKTVSTDLTDYY